VSGAKSFRGRGRRSASNKEYSSGPHLSRYSTFSNISIIWGRDRYLCRRLQRTRGKRIHPLRE
jgi:hypothetical protein